MKLLSRSGYIITRQSEGAVGEIVLGGLPKMSIGNCSLCDKPFTRFFTVPAGPSGFNEDIELVYCWPCEAVSHNVSYTVDGELVEYSPTENYDDFPYENYPQTFPEEIWYLHERKALPMTSPPSFGSKRADLGEPAHLIGGMPCVWNPIDAQCPKCKEAQSFLAMVGDEAPGGGTFAGNSAVGLLYFICKNCEVVSVHQTVD